ncbi:MAG TPA: MogA/MoaB family molybdenum cofactor biosynthesis protein [Nitrososphaerales archaeon]|nr:MogA/MoaB family molybdenum cofactor biosynthesis protein [Nitrososphaerales archaeon]
MVTVSTSRYRQRSSPNKPAGDESGDLAQQLIEESGGAVTRRVLIPDDAEMLRRTVSRALTVKSVDVVVLTGGTGVSTTDVTIESVRPFFEKEIGGFGEVFRYVSFQKIGAAAMLSRATAGIAKQRLILCLPGSPDAVRTALQLILGEVPHVLSLTRGH